MFFLNKYIIWFECLLCFYVVLCLLLEYTQEMLMCNFTTSQTLCSVQQSVRVVYHISVKQPCCWNTSGPWASFSSHTFSLLHPWEIFVFISFKVPWDCWQSCASHLALLKLASSATQHNRVEVLAVCLFIHGLHSISTTVSHFRSLLRSWAERWLFWRPPATPSAPAPAHTWTQTACLVCAA